MLQITLLADEWKSSKGGLSTLNRELAIQMAKQPNVSVTFLVPKCGEADRNAACSHKIQVVEAEERPGFPPVDWLCFPPEDLVIDVIVGHGAPLGKQAQIIKKSHHCTWMQVVHTTPEELAMHKTYPDAISKGDAKQCTELRLCEIADFVVAIGPKLFEFYSVHLRQCGKTVFNLTPGIFTELSDLPLSTEEAKKFRVLLFGRGDSEDFKLKGLDIAAKAVAELNDRSYQLKFVGAPSGKEEIVRNGLLEHGLNQSRSQLTVKGFIENRKELARLLSTANLVVVPSRTEGFGLTALEALSAGLPFLVSHNSGFGEALEEIRTGVSWIIDSEDPEEWAKVIKGVREKGSKTALKECQELRTLYAKKYSWEKQCKDLVETIVPLVNAKRQASNSDQGTSPKETPPDPPSSIDRTELKEKLQTSNSDQGTRPREAPTDPPSSSDRTKLKEKLQTSNSDQGAGPREAPPDPPSSTDRTKLKEKLQTSNSDQEAKPSEAPPDPPSSTDRTELKAKRQASNSDQGTSPKETPPEPPSSIDRTELKDNLQTSNSDQWARPKEAPPSSNDRAKLKDNLQTLHSDGPKPRQSPKQGARPEESSSPSIDRTKLKAEAEKPPASRMYQLERNRVEEKSVQPSRRRNLFQEDQPITEQRREDSLFSSSNNTKQKRKLHVFICDRTYSLESVEDLLAAMKAKLDFDPVLEKHYFSFSEMPEMTIDIIPKLQMDMAFFVVNAQESRLSINEDNAFFSYTTAYRALLEATGGRVLIVIGGDDQYRGEEEEERTVISRWARRQVASQFNEECLDGRRSFIFSWNKKHREIHEEALLHYFDSSKEGQKFEYQPKPRKPESDQSAQTTSERALLLEYVFTDEQIRRQDNLETLNSEGPKPRQRPKQGARPEESSSSSINRPKLKAEAEKPPASSVYQRERNRVEEKSVQPSRWRNFLQEDQPIIEQRREDSLFSSSNNTKQKRKLHVFNCEWTYFSLESVKDLVAAVKGKLDFDPVVKEHYFALFQMTEMTTNINTKLQMDMAFFVVNAQGSRLSINEDNAGIGYAKIYRALLGATGGRVLIVIGGDHQYRGKDEGERTVISRWARRKVASQFKEEYLDGRRSFIFSWNKKHREIHEEALLHYFDSSKEGKKFEYQPKPRQLESDQSAQKTSERTPLLEYPFTDEQRRSEDNLQALKSEGPKPRQRSKQGARPKESSPSRTDRTKLKAEAEKPPAGSVSQLERNRVEEKSVQPSMRRDFLQEDQPIIEQRREDSLFSSSSNTKQKRKLRAFNCDVTYSLESVEDLLAAVKGKLDFDPVVEKHYFALYQMTEMTTNIIPKLQMDMAFFVVNAQKSRLSINEDNAGIGYAKIYRALLEATGGKVIIVIGDDEHYQSEDEEDRVVISRWAKRKIHLQFNVEFLDGRKSFIFSWNKKHREIHEEALLHYFDPSKKEQKFEYQPKPRQPESDQSAQTTSETALSGTYHSTNEQRGSEDLAILCCNLSEDSTHAVMEILQDIVPKQNLSANPPVENLSPGNIKRYLTEVHLKACVLVVDGKEIKDAYEKQPQRKEEYRGLLKTAANRVVEKLIVLICDNCSLPPKDESIVSQTIVDIVALRGKGHIAWLKNGGLSVDPDVLVQILTSPAPQILTSPASQPIPQPIPQPSQPIPQTSLSRGTRYHEGNDAPGSAAELFSSSSGQSQSDPFERNRSDWQATTTIQPGDPPATCSTGEPVLLRSLLHYGIISYDEEHLQLRDPAFTVPDHIKQDLYELYNDTPETGVLIVRDFDGKPEWSIDPKLIEISKSRYGKGIQMDYNETLLLKTRIFYGQVSFQESDVHYRFNNWQIPQNIIDSLRREYWATPSGQLYIISDGRENVRWVVNIGIASRARTFLNKCKDALGDRFSSCDSD